MSALYENIQVILTRSGKGVWVCGSTTPIKDQLKSMGGTWNPSKKCWVFTIANLPQLVTFLNYDESQIEVEPEQQTKQIKKKQLPQTQEFQVIITRSGKGVLVCGPTTPIKDQLKALGGSWNPSKKCWVFTRDQLANVLQLLNFDPNLVQFEEPIVQPKKTLVKKQQSIKKLVKKQASQIEIRLDEDKINIYVCGKDTYGIKEDLKSKMQAKWNPGRRCWQIPFESIEAMVGYFGLDRTMINTLMEEELLSINL